MSLSLTMQNYQLPTDTSVSALLARYRQGADIVRRFWEPLCLATLNTPLEKASASVFLRVLQESFTRHAHDSDLLIPRVPLGQLFCETAAHHLQTSPTNTVMLGCKASGIEQENGKVAGITTTEGTLTGKDVIIATSPVAASRMLEQTEQTSELAARIGQLGSQPITTLYLYYPSRPCLSQPMIGFGGTVTQWLFDRTVCAQPGWYAVVISAKGKHSEWSREQLVQHVQQELVSLLPDWPAEAERAVVIREKRATFECSVGIDKLRPGNATAIPGLWLAGDYTDTGYPATLEGAVMSGVQCAHEIIARRQTRH